MTSPLNSELSVAQIPTNSGGVSIPAIARVKAKIKTIARKRRLILSISGKLSWTHALIGIRMVPVVVTGAYGYIAENITPVW